MNHSSSHQYLLSPFFPYRCLYDVALFGKDYSVALLCYLTCSLTDHA